jgi:hypothetical protein
MKPTTSSKIYLPMAAIIVTAALAIPAAAQTQVPFKGVFNGKDAVNAPTITTTGMGVFTHLGESSITQVTTLTSKTSGTGSAHWVAANGDSIDSTFIASADYTTASLGYITVTETHTITGATGRFTGVEGSFILERTHIVAPSADGTHVTFGSIHHGTITFPDVSH